jgi:hypothetical protein
LSSGGARYVEVAFRPGSTATRHPAIAKLNALPSTTMVNKTLLRPPCDAVVAVTASAPSSMPMLRMLFQVANSRSCPSPSGVTAPTRLPCATHHRHEREAGAGPSGRHQ